MSDSSRLSSEDEAKPIEPISSTSSSVMTSSMLLLTESTSQADEGKPAPAAMVMVTLFSPPEVGMSSSVTLKESSVVLPLTSSVPTETVCSVSSKSMAATSPPRVSLMMMSSDPLVANAVPPESVSKPSNVTESPSASRSSVSANPILFLLGGASSSAMVMVWVKLPALGFQPFGKPSGSERSRSVRTSLSSPSTALSSSTVTVRSTLSVFAGRVRVPFPSEPGTYPVPVML